MNAFRDSVPSPCTGVCQMTSDNGWCVGCLRTLDEIVDWCRKTADEKRGVLARIQARTAAGPAAVRSPSDHPPR